MPTLRGCSPGLVELNKSFKLLHITDVLLLIQSLYPLQVGQVITKYNIAEIACKAYQMAMTPGNIHSLNKAAIPEGGEVGSQSGH